MAYGILPTQVLDVWAELSEAEAEVAVALSRHMSMEGVCWPSAAAILAACRLRTERAVSLGLKRLEERGLLQVERKPFRHSIYRWPWGNPCAAKDDRGRAVQAEPGRAEAVETAQAEPSQADPAPSVERQASCSQTPCVEHSLCSTQDAPDTGHSPALNAGRPIQYRTYPVKHTRGVSESQSEVCTETGTEKAEGGRMKDEDTQEGDRQQKPRSSSPTLRSSSLRSTSFSLHPSSLDVPPAPLARPMSSVPTLAAGGEAPALALGSEPTVDSPTGRTPEQPVGHERTDAASTIPYNVPAPARSPADALRIDPVRMRLVKLWFQRNGFVLKGGLEALLMGRARGAGLGEDPWFAGEARWPEAHALACGFKAKSTKPPHAPQKFLGVILERGFGVAAEHVLAAERWLRQAESTLVDPEDVAEGREKLLDFCRSLRAKHARA